MESQIHCNTVFMLQKSAGNVYYQIFEMSTEFVKFKSSNCRKDILPQWMLQVDACADIVMATRLFAGQMPFSIR